MACPLMYWAEASQVLISCSHPHLCQVQVCFGVTCMQPSSKQWLYNISPDMQPHQMQNNKLQKLRITTIEVEEEQQIPVRLDMQLLLFSWLQACWRWSQP